jgi:DNA repair exonuclease SbcCD ATPase subunit
LKVDQLIVENYQAHKQVVLQFCGGVNVLQGESHSGKTALLRALLWCLLNKPRGEGFINWDAEDVMVTLTTDGFSVARSKGTHYGNCYDLLTEHGDTHYEAFGADIPEAISALLNVSDINIQKQLSPYFLVNSPAGQIAHYIRSVSKLDEIDTTVSILKNRSKAASNLLTNKQVESGAIEAKLEELDTIMSGVDLLDMYIEAFEVSKDKRGQLNTDVVKLDALIVSLKTAIVFFPDVVQFEVLTEQLEAYRKAEANFAVLDCREDRLTDLIASIQFCDEQSEELAGELVLASDERDRVMEQLKECPYCGTPLTADSKKRLLEK